jgi:5-dehydro-2-deoxygluconokinase
MPRGYNRPLYILPFDHRDSFETKLFGWKSSLSAAQTAEIASAKSPAVSDRERSKQWQEG